MDKQKEYEVLVAEVKNYVLRSHGGNQPFQHYDHCDAINPWAYWQGRSVTADGAVLHHLNAQILLVGRDWGDTDKNVACVASIQAIQRHQAQRYITPGIFDGIRMSNATDERVRKLFIVLGYNITASALEDPQNLELSFTNIYPCFRSGGNTGKLPHKNPTLERKFFGRLVEIIQPSAVLCLGSDAYREARCALHKPVQRKELVPYAQFVEQDWGTHVDVDGSDIVIFALAHPGPLGTIGRVRGCENVSAQAGEAAQIKDWEKVKTYLSNQQANRKEGP